MSEMGQVDELRGLARLGFDELRRATGGIAGVHLAVAARAFRASGRGALPARTLHDAISNGVYAGLAEPLASSGAPPTPDSAAAPSATAGPCPRRRAARSCSARSTG
jgi:hypothetical protein